MSQRRRGRRAAASRALISALCAVAAAINRLWRVLRRRHLRVEVLITDRRRGRVLAIELKATLRRLRRVLGPALPSEMVVVVQQVVRAERPLVGCYEVARRPDGGRFVLVRVALTVGGRKLADDEVIAALADQCIALADLGTREVVPLESESAPPVAQPERPAALRGDPLVGRDERRSRRAA